MKTKISLTRIYHHDKWCIAISFEYDGMLKEKVKSIPGSLYSSTHRCFYVEDNEENLKRILGTMKDDAEIDISAIAWKYGRAEKIQAPEDIQSGHDPDGSDAGHFRDEEEYPSQVTVYKVSGISRGEAYKKTSSSKESFSPVELRINEKEGLLVIRFHGMYDKEWIREMRSYGRLEYDKITREWTLPWSKLAGDSLSDYFSGKGIEVNVSRKVIDEDLLHERKAIGDEIRSRALGSQALEGLDLMTWFLDENRYSPRTKESYLAMLEFFFRYFSPREPEEIAEEEISKFLYDFIIKLGYSAAYQNQMVSAIKTYYTVSGRGRVSPEFLQRPRRSRALPKVFSKEEVTRILNSGGNIKHKMILWMVYSCGLRRSEVTNLKLEDLDRERSILHVREGKGRIDRFVPVPGKVWNKLDEYISGYHPVEYLFEGQGGGRYSSESVYRLFKDALVKAGIKKDVGVHSLRHSYATHLHENGLDIRYIQELLGHKSTRTTEIYTHVSRRNLVAVRSPIEDLDLK